MRSGLSANFITLVMSMVMLGLLIVTLRVQERENHPEKSQAQQKEDQSAIKNAKFEYLSLIRIIMFTGAYAVWDALTFQEVSSVNIEGVDFGDYFQRYEFATLYSIITLFIIAAISIGELMVNGRLKAKYTIQKNPSVYKSIMELSTAILFLSSFHVWTSTAIIIYTIEGFGSVIRDATLSYAGLMAFLWIYLGLALVNLVIIIRCKKEIDGRYDRYLVKNKIIKKGKKDLPMTERIRKLKKKQAKHQFKKARLKKCPNCHVTSMPIIEGKCPSCGKDF